MATIQLRENQTYLANGELDPDSGTVVPNHYLVDGALWVTKAGQTIEEALVEPRAPAPAAYKMNLRKEYPSIDDFMEAYTEKEIGSDSTKWDAYVTAYNKVRTDNPKS